MGQDLLIFLGSSPPKKASSRSKICRDRLQEIRHCLTTTTMSVDIKHANPDKFPSPVEDEEALTLRVDWTKEEETRAKRK